MPSAQSPRQNEHSANISQTPAKNRNLSRCAVFHTNTRASLKYPATDFSHRKIEIQSMPIYLKKIHEKKKKQILKNIKTK